ncbi:cytochrome c biogenesis protein [Gimesia fumaroli]|uniref:Cytochrome c biogenesis protein CcsA n=1 Tax=Gimesia fumaroli TaxID=2527976 RepID=A0A518I6H2_9PLAN|nr:cytochrome c biogenesis protein CcsA [Gimesia fumaroli]QDV48702.1 Cytochrome c biogenesis protein CcsA [Gimesia fumaroli]
MSTNTLSDTSSEFATTDSNSGSANSNEQFLKILQPFASLKLTVVLFAMAIFIILAGTLAQVNKDIWVVIDEYFRTGIAKIEFKIFFPPSFFPNLDQQNIPGFIYFPGGWLIGFMMGINLFAAHFIRFKVQAKGTRRTAGWITIAVGLLITWAVIASGSNKDGFQETPLLSWSALWAMIEVGMAACVLGCIWLFFQIESYRKVERGLAVLGAGLFACLLIWFLSQGDAARFSDSSMRILWQLIKATFAGVVLLAGCIVLFKKRAGVVLLHGGVGLMMLSELMVGTMAVETQMTISEGETTNYVHDIRTIELAIIDQTDPKQDQVTVIPKSILLANRDGVVSDPKLPFNYELVKYYPNASIRKVSSLTPEEKKLAENLATDGIGKDWIALPARSATGTDTGGAVDTPAAYIKIIDKKTDDSLGVYLVSLEMALQEIGEQVEVDGKPYQLYLRFKRTYKPYSVKLIDVRKDDYAGTTTVMNYSSDIHLVDPTTNVDRDIKIWMNNPLRYSGETFYQSGYHADPRTGKELTTLSVVTNMGWMIPYVSCMIVAVGMLYHFMITLLRFLGRREKQRIEPAAVSEVSLPDESVDAASQTKQRLIANLNTYLIPALILVIFGGYLMSKARIPKTPSNQMHLYEFGELPILYQGRAKPIDTLARNSLRIISGRQDFEVEYDADGKIVTTAEKEEAAEEEAKAAKESKDKKDNSDAKVAKKKKTKTKKYPAIKWLLDTIAKPQEAYSYNVFRIENPDLLHTLGLKKRPGFRYSLEDFIEKLPELTKQAELARQAGQGKASLYQSRVLDLEKKIGIVDLLIQSFTPPNIRAESAREDLIEAIRRHGMLDRRNPPRVIPPGGAAEEEAEWQTYSYAWTRDLVKASFSKDKENEATQAWTKILVAYSQGNTEEFNKEVRNYQTWLKKHQADLTDVSLSKIDYEAFFNHFEPFYYCSVLYLIAFILVCVSFLIGEKTLGSAAFWLIVLTFVVHTFALISRIYISGRPPVTNLYSSAVFIGWGAVLAGIVIERMNRMGIGNLLAGVSGFSTLLIAHMLAGDGDTMAVLQAVLDTQFWLATHVVCITLGYAATFVAGLLGLFYILWGTCTPRMTANAGKEIIRMLYGVLCFAIFLSFVGTVLGGLWADDSWGRFWGWDPKENGALIIVLWNALVLHARWGGMVKDRGLAILSIGGNIVTSWSWFGVNELGVGLHSYGFTEGVLMALGLFMLSQLAVMAIAMIPQNQWWSFKNRDA